MTVQDTTIDGAHARSHAPVTPRTVGWAATLDAVAIVVFVTVGRSSHEEGVTLVGVASTAWPFLVGAAVGWAVARLWQRPLRLLSALPVWLGSIVIGMGLRAATGQGTALSFVIVATLFLCATLFGWRLVALAASRLRGRRAV